MRAIRARVVNGKVVTRAKLREGARLTVLVHDGDESIGFDTDDEAEISRGIAEINAGRFVGADRARSFLRRR
jgi:predicted transcriptional regulator